MINKITGFILGVVSLVLLSPFLVFLFSLASFALFVCLMIVSGAIIVGIVGLFIPSSDKTIEIQSEEKHYYR